jgi:hypothetical protein
MRPPARPDGNAYGRPPARHDPVLTEVGAGTPMGELMRRYWHPIGLTADAGAVPRRVQVHGEELILFRDGQTEFLGTRPRIDTTPRFDDVFHTVIDGDRVDLIAWRHFDRAELWWVVCDYNDLFFPLDLEPGTVLRLPSREHLLMRVLG